MQFKLLSIETFPEVTMSDFPMTLQNTQSWLTEMDMLLDGYQDFVLVYNATDLCQTEQQNKEEMKACCQLVTQWVHEKRALLKQKCRGIILPIQEGTNDLTIIEVYREEIESYYKIPTEVLYHPQDLPLLAHALIHDCWDAHSMHLHKVPAL
ncbi:hypothetical protein MMG00_07545 [Ignatzschineria rhizosphaerae]|uniref:Uncharacterized protein n=1 Tax=Ignatzschineria rhizosphaerae TaxID=2923279 RepID=A0ABY3WWW0_9GAMM|nr:hypothetical protein [Ignatzschineria rhizosphaerae]UNM95093.1 hypothetical protein MMG00_07545 [Ignatzschineria rhizosphaerae]